MNIGNQMMPETKVIRGLRRSIFPQGNQWPPARSTRRRRTPTVWRVGAPWVEARRASLA